MLGTVGSFDAPEMASTHFVLTPGAIGFDPGPVGFDPGPVGNQR